MLQKNQMTMLNVIYLRMVQILTRYLLNPHSTHFLKSWGARELMSTLLTPAFTCCKLLPQKRDDCQVRPSRRLLERLAFVATGEVPIVSLLSLHAAHRSHTCVSCFIVTRLYSLISLYLGNFRPLLFSKKCDCPRGHHLEVWLIACVGGMYCQCCDVEPPSLSWEMVGISGQVWTTSINVTKVNWILNWLYALVHKVDFLICIEK
jgi:hypothetical protein